MERQAASDRARALLVKAPDVDWSSVSTEELVARCLAGNSRARREVWDRYCPSVRRLLRRRLTEDVEDQLQETFIRVFQGLGRLREPAALHGYILGVAFRVRQTEVRRLSRFRALFTRDAELIADVPHQQNDGEERETIRRLWVALERAGEDARVLFILRHIEELELTEIARVLEVSLATAKRRLARAMSRVNAVMAANPSFGSLVSSARKHENP